MGKARLSKLQRWILKTALANGSTIPMEDEEKIEGLILRRYLVIRWFGLYNLPDSPGPKTYMERRIRYEKEAKKFNASLSRSLCNLRSKGLIHTYYRLNNRKFRRHMRLHEVEPGARLPKIDALLNHNDEDVFGVSIQYISITNEGKKIVA